MTFGLQFEKKMLSLPLVRLTVFFLFSLFQDGHSYSLTHSLACYLPGFECCTEPYVKFQTAYLWESLQLKLFGQHLLSSAVIAPLSVHLKSKAPSQPLIFFFHGGPGTGKTCVANMLLKATFSYGSRSRFVRIFYFGTTFPNTIKETELVESVHFQIWSLSKICERAVFVFDGYDSVWAKILKALKLKDEILYKKNIFVFIAGIATNALERHIFQEHQNGRAREDLTVKELLNVSKSQLIAETGLLFNVLSWDDIEYVPFLPLTQTHLRQCIQRELKRQKSSTVLSKKIFDAIITEADKEFVASGCKLVIEKTIYILAQHRDEL